MVKRSIKNQINFKSGLGKIKKGNPDLKLEKQVSAIQTVGSFMN